MERSRRLPLEEINMCIQAFALLDTGGFDVGERLVSVDVWLADAEQVEIGAVDNEDGFLGIAHCRVGAELVSLKWHF